MEYVTLTTEIKMKFGITSSFVTINGNDYIVILKKITTEMCMFTCPEMDLSCNEEIKLTFLTKYGKIEENVKVDCFFKDEIMFVVEVRFNYKNKNEFFIQLENFINELTLMTKRKEDRILCTRENLKRLRLINKIQFEYNTVKYQGMIKDISFSAFRILTNPLLLNDNGSLFRFKLQFTDPEENFIFTNCCIIRKEMFEFESQKFAQIVFKIEPTINYKKRINEYFNENEKRYLKSFSKK